MERLEIVSLSLIFFAVLVITLGIIKIHTYPGKVAAARKHPQTEAIEVTSLLGLLIFPLWMLALVWAYSGAVIGKLYIEEDGMRGEVPPSNGPSAAVSPAETAPIPASEPAASAGDAATRTEATTPAAATPPKDPAHTADDADGPSNRERGTETREGD